VTEPTPAPHLDDFPLPPFGDLFDKSVNPDGRSPFYDLESHFWARDQQRELLRVAAGWWAMAWFCSSYSEELARKLGNKARVYEARAERLVYSEWIVSTSVMFAAAAILPIMAAVLFRPGKS